MRNVHSERTGHANKVRVALKGEESNVDHHRYPVTHGESKRPLLHLADRETLTARGLGVAAQAAGLKIALRQCRGFSPTVPRLAT